MCKPNGVPSNETCSGMLRDQSRQHGARFEAFNLRWGVSAEVSLEQQAAEICFEEIKR